MYFSVSRLEELEDPFHGKRKGEPRDNNLTKRLKHKQWLQGFDVDFIQVEGRPDLDVLIVSRNDTVIHTEVVDAPTVDMEVMDSPPLRPMPYGQHRTFIEPIGLTEEEGLQDSKDMEEDLHLAQQKQQ